MRTIQIISAPSILGLWPGGVEHLGRSLLAAGLSKDLKSAEAVIHIPTFNDRYSFERDAETKCINTAAIHDFSLLLMREMAGHIGNHSFPVVLGGDCSILIGIMPALKATGAYGLISLDAHADFYEPHQSSTGEVADMGLAIVTGRGPDILTNINGLKPYVKDEHVIHIVQRDREETKKYKSQDIKDTAIRCFDLETIRSKGLNKITEEALTTIHESDLGGYWIHFDTDVIDDDENPAVDYRIPGGLSFKETGLLLKKLAMTGKMTGISVTVFNPTLDKKGEIARKISACMGDAF